MTSFGPAVERPPVVDQIVHFFNIRIYVLLAVASLILIFDIAANARNSEAIDVWGMLGLIPAAAGIILVKLARDLRALRKWTVPWAYRLLFRMGGQQLAARLRQAEVLLAFGIASQEETSVDTRCKS